MGSIVTYDPRATSPSAARNTEGGPPLHRGDPSPSYRFCTLSSPPLQFGKELNFKNVTGDVPSDCKPLLTGAIIEYPKPVPAGDTTGLQEQITALTLPKSPTSAGKKNDKLQTSKEAAQARGNTPLQVIND